MPVRKRGGRVSPHLRGGPNKDGYAYKEGLSARPVDHGPGKQDRMDIGRPKAITYKKGGRVKGFGLGSHGHGQGGFEDRGSAKHMSGGLEPPTGATHGHANEAPHHPRKGQGPLEHKTHGQMSPDFNVGSGGGTARLMKRKRAPKFVDRVP
jgi:hypothetical protein